VWAQHLHGEGQVVPCSSRPGLPWQVSSLPGKPTQLPNSRPLSRRSCPRRCESARPTLRVRLPMVIDTAPRAASLLRAERWVATKNRNPGGSQSSPRDKGEPLASSTMGAFGQSLTSTMTATKSTHGWACLEDDSGVHALPGLIRGEPEDGLESVGRVQGCQTSYARGSS